MYTRQKVHPNNKDPSAIPLHHQSSSSTESIDVSAPGNSSSTPLVLVPPENIILDLDMPVALRKGVGAYTQHLISKYVSYKNLSSKHKAFISKITHLFVPRTIREALQILD